VLRWAVCGTYTKRMYWGSWKRATTFCRNNRQHTVHREETEGRCEGKVLARCRLLQNTVSLVLTVMCALRSCAARLSGLLRLLLG
jgi:hypothetical protein